MPDHCPACSAVLFDLDGTLLDTLDDIAAAANRALQAEGFSSHPHAAYKQFIGDGVATLFRRALDGHANEDRITRLLGHFRDAYTTGWKLRTCPYEGINELLQGLQQRGVRLAVLSNKPDEFAKLCVRQFFPGIPFEPVFGERPGVSRKPSPEGALEAARILGLDPARILYLGDSSVDMCTAVAAGMHPVGALWGFRSADELSAHGARALVSHPLEVLTLLDSLPAAEP